MVTSGQGAEVTSSGQTEHDVTSGHWVVFGDIISGQVVAFSTVTFGQTGQLDSPLGGAVVEVVTSTVFGAQVTLDDTSVVWLKRSPW